MYYEQEKYDIRFEWGIKGTGDIKDLSELYNSQVFLRMFLVSN
jgi:hypothetical protein